MQRIGMILAVVLAVMAVPCHAQEGGPGRITGEVIDDATGDPLAGATVEVRAARDSSLVEGIVTDSSGAFVASGLPRGRYVVRIRFVGYRTTRLTDVRLTRSRPKRDVGRIRLVRDTKQLGEVTISAERPPVEIQTDRTVYNTQQQIVTAGGSARTVLNDLPSIEVDLDGSVSLRGSEGVVVHVNGEPTSLSGESLSSFLQSLPASAVERVEVIPNPSAKEEPEGSAGIINIVLKRNRSAGWSGGVTAGAGTNASYNASGNVGYQAGAWRVFANYGYRRGEEDEYGSWFRRNRTVDPITLLDRSNTEEERERSHTLNTQVEYQPGPSTTLTLENVLSLETEDQRERADFTRETAGGALLDRFARIDDGTSGERSLDLRLSGSHEFASDHDLALQLRYEGARESEDNTYTQRDLSSGSDLGPVQERERDDLDEVEQEGSLELDYTRPLAGLTLETGYQAEARTQTSEQLFLAAGADGPLQPESTSRFDFDDQTHALYAQLTVPLADFWTVKGGLRAERTWRTFALPERNEAFDETYSSLFPSVFLTYDRNETYLARLSYSKRIRRPDTWQLDPVDDNADPAFRFVGNPQLDPEYVHSFELSLSRQWEPASVSVTPFFRRTINEIERNERLQSNGVTILTFDNFSSSNSYGVEVVTSLDLNDYVRGNVSVNANRIVTDASNVDSDLSNDAMAYSARANLTFELGYGVSLQASQSYSAPRDIAGGRIGSRRSTDLALRKDLFGGDGSLSLRGSDLFNASEFYVRRDTDDSLLRARWSRAQRQITATFTYSFGSTDTRGR